MTTKLFEQRGARYILIAVVATLAMFLPALVSAAQVTERSIALSSSSAEATGVTYEVNFTAVGAAGAFVVDFCSDTPIIGQTCTAPTGFTATGTTSASAGFTDVTTLDANTVVVAGTIAADQDVSVALEGITNPDVAGPLYARILTFVADTDADAYTSTVPGANVVDDGGVAVSITETIGVSGAVLETMTFCVSGATIAADCVDADTTAPVLRLGETVGDTVALTTAVSTGDIYTQISTNAASGAVVRLKSNAEGCGGLLRAGAPTACDILPALTGNITTGEAKFGVLAAAAADTGTNPNGTFQAINAYNDTSYVLNYVDGDATGVTSVYGDEFLDTGDAPANNKNMQLTFGAAVSNNTPAGLYSADLSLIATGKF